MLVNLGKLIKNSSMLFKNQKNRLSSLCLQKTFLQWSVTAEMWGCAHMVNGADSAKKFEAVPNSVLAEERH